MKISNRIPTFEKPEIESPVDKYKGPDSAERQITQQSAGNKSKAPDSFELPKASLEVEQYKGPDSIKVPEIISEVDKYKGPKSLPEKSGIESRLEDYKRPNPSGRQNTQNQDEIVDLIRNGADDFYANFGRLRQGLPDQNDESTPPQISSRAEKYKGPDSFEPPKASSEVEKYKGPDSMKLPEIISEVDQYKGPKSLVEESRIKSLLGDYKSSHSRGPQPTQTPDEYVDLIRNGADDFVANFGRVRNGSQDQNEEPSEPKISSSVEKYKGPDSFELPKASSEVEKYKGPDSTNRAEWGHK